MRLWTAHFVVAINATEVVLRAIEKQRAVVRIPKNRLSERAHEAHFDKTKRSNVSVTDVKI